MVYTVLPIRQSQSKGVLKLTGRQPGVLRTASGRRVLACWDRVNSFRWHPQVPARCSGVLDYMAGILVPVGLATRRVMVETIWQALLADAVLAQQVRGHICQSRGGGQRSPLVRHRLQPVSL